MARIRSAWKLFGELVGFARHNRLYWIVPLVVILAIAGVAIVVGQGAAPLIYTIF